MAGEVLINAAAESDGNLLTILKLQQKNNVPIQNGGRSQIIGTPYTVPTQ